MPAAHGQRAQDIATGVEQRQRNSGYRNSNRYGAGYAASVDVSDLEGARAAGAESDMQSRGFRSVDGFQSGNNGKGTVWWNSRTRQCLQMLVSDGRVDSIAPASGQEFALLPPDNATGNFTKVVQRIPVKIVLDRANPLAGALRPGMSVYPTIDTKAAVKSASAH